MHNYQSLISGSVLAVLLAGLSGCAKEERGPLEVTSAKGQDEIRAVIGREGGILQFSDTGDKLMVPPNLLLEEVTITFKREKPSFDLPGKDFVGNAYRISPRLSFAPGTAKLYVPLDKALPGLPEDINLNMYYYDRLDSEGPEGPTFVHAWQIHPVTKFSGYSEDGKFLVFEIHETVSDRTTKPPFGLFQAAFDMT